MQYLRPGRWINVETTLFQHVPIGLPAVQLTTMQAHKVFSTMLQRMTLRCNDIKTLFTIHWETYVDFKPVTDFSAASDQSLHCLPLI